MCGDGNISVNCCCLCSVYSAAGVQIKSETALDYDLLVVNGKQLLYAE